MFDPIIIGAHQLPAPLDDEPKPQTRRKSFGVGGVRAALGGGQPANWATDHRAETDQFKAWHYIAVHAIAKQAAQATITVYNDAAIGSGVAKSIRGDLRRQHGSRWKAVAAALNEKAADVLRDDHRLVRLYKRPNPWQSGASFRYEIAQQLGLTGTCLIWKVPNALGGTAERYVIPTGVAEPISPSRSLPRGGYRINPAAARSWAMQHDPEGFVEVRGFFRAIGHVLPMEQIMATRWPHALFKDDGQSPVSAGALWTDAAGMLDMTRWGQLLNGADPSIAVIGPEDADLDDDELTVAATKFNQKYAGPKNSGKAAFFNNGTNVVKLSNTPREMAYELAFPQYRDALMGIHGTPPAAAGITESTSFAALYASLLQFVTLTVQPMLSLHAEEETEQQAREFGAGLTVEIEASGLDDPQILESQLVNDAAVGARTINEWRAARGLPPVPWGEERAVSGGGGASMMPSLPGQHSMVSAGERGGGMATAAGGSGSDGEAGIAVESSLTLNGAQIDAARNTLLDVRLGTLPDEAAIELLIGVGIPRDRAEAMVASLQGMPPPTVDANGKPLEQAPTGGGATAPNNSASFRGASRLEWTRTQRSTDEVIARFQEGSLKEGAAMVRLTALGWTDEQARQLLDADAGNDPQENDWLAANAKSMRGRADDNAWFTVALNRARCRE